MPDNDNKMSSDHDLLVRIDERTKTADEFMRHIQKTMVTQSEFKPVRLIVYGAVALVSSTVGIAVLGLVISKAG